MLITGLVIDGDKFGRTIGFPTANFKLAAPLNDLKPGVYLCKGDIRGKTHFGLAYYGPRYIHGELNNSFEVYYYDFTGDLYREQLTIELLQYMRAPEKFTTAEDLATQLQEDKIGGQKLISDFS